MITLDISIIAFYLIALFGWAVYIGVRETADDFFIFSRRAPFYLLLFSVISTWVGTGTIIVTAASTYEKGLSLGLMACCGGLLGAVGAALFAPKLKAFGDMYNAYTLGDFFLTRYARSSAVAAGLLILTVYLLFTAGQMIGLTSLLQVWTSGSFELLIIGAALTTVLYTAFAGIKSDFYTDAVHFFVMLFVLFFILLPVSYQKADGFHLIAQLPETFFDPFAYGGPIFFVAGVILGGLSIFVMMEFWQRVFAAESGRAARWSLALSMIFITGFYAAATLLGFYAKALIPDIENRDLALFALMNELLPPGVLGLGIAGFIAIFLSSLNSMIMVASAVLTKDIWYNFAKETNRTPEKMLRVGRVTTLICGLSGLGIALALPDLVALSVNALFMLFILLPSIIGGFIWEKATAKAALYSILSGLAVMIVFLGINRDTAFMPGFLVSLAVYVAAAFLTSPSGSENKGIVRFWKSLLLKG